jgi:hypothetical protein
VHLDTRVRAPLQCTTAELKGCAYVSFSGTGEQLTAAEQDVTTHDIPSRILPIGLVYRKPLSIVAFDTGEGGDTRQLRHVHCELRAQVLEARAMTFVA